MYKATDGCASGCPLAARRAALLAGEQAARGQGRQPAGYAGPPCQSHPKRPGRRRVNHLTPRRGPGSQALEPTELKCSSATNALMVYTQARQPSNPHTSLTTAATCCARTRHPSAPRLSSGARLFCGARMLGARMRRRGGRGRPIAPTHMPPGQPPNSTPAGAPPPPCPAALWGQGVRRTHITHMTQPRRRSAPRCWASPIRTAAAAAALYPSTSLPQAPLSAQAGLAPCPSRAPCAARRRGGAPPGRPAARPWPPPAAAAGPRWWSWQPSWPPPPWPPGLCARAGRCQRWRRRRPRGWRPAGRAGGHGRQQGSPRASSCLATQRRRRRVCWQAPGPPAAPRGPQRASASAAAAAHLCHARRDLQQLEVVAHAAVLEVDLELVQRRDRVVDLPGGHVDAAGARDLRARRRERGATGQARRPAGGSCQAAGAAAAVAAEPAGRAGMQSCPRRRHPRPACSMRR
jgi:hypothetical protein